MTPLDTMRALRATLPTPMSADQLGTLLNAVAWAHRSEGYGVLSKPSGANCRQPHTRELISRDILALPDGRIFDALIDAEGKGTPTWGKKKPVAANRWRAPVDVSIALPPLSVTIPGPPSVSQTQPYPDEAIWWTELLNDIEALYYRAGRQTIDLGMFKWVARTAYDIGAGSRKELARAKHLEELRAALGLG